MTTKQQFAIKAFSKEGLYLEPKGVEGLYNEIKIMKTL